MKNEIMRLNSNALSAFSKTLSLANQLKEEKQHRPAEWLIHQKNGSDGGSTLNLSGVKHLMKRFFCAKI